MSGQTSDLQLVLKEGKRRVLTLTTVFSVSAVMALGIDLLIPKKWDATALIVAESSNIIKPLMEGRAVPTGIADQSALITQVITSKRILRELLADGGWLKKKVSPEKELILLEQLKARIKIEAPKEGTIRIGYSDSEPKRTQLITNKVAEIYVRESTNLKEQESREAFDFINDRVKEYRDRLAEDHGKLLAYYRGQTQPAPEIDAPVVPPAAEPTTTIRARSKLSPEELAALRAEEATLTAQLGHKSAAAPTNGGSAQMEEQYRSRVLQIQNELDRLRVTYTDEHPDVKRAGRDLAIAKEELHNAEQARLDGESARAAASALDDEVSRAARARLDEVRTKIADATGVVVHHHTPRASGPVSRVVLSDANTAPEMRGIGQDTTLSELSRRYEATRDVYQDLLKRRENARVSMDLDAERRGLTMRIEEAAELPLVASGLRLFQLSLIGLIIAALLPIGYLFALVRLDTRVRSAEQIERLARLPLLVTIPAGPTAIPFQTRGRYAALMVTAVLVVYIAAFVVRLKLTSS